MLTTRPETLGAHLAGRRHSPDDFVFTSPEGGALRHNLFYRRIFKARRRGRRPARRASLPRPAAHVSGHLFPERAEAVADTLEGVLSRARSAGGHIR